ncbi:MAG: PDZ domain-containing protein [Thermaerobacter sp.]|nr:hypothetical protein [Bacillota bacterium]
MSPLLRRRVAIVALLAALAAVAAGAWRVRLPLFVVGPGPVVPAAQVVHVAGLDEPAGDPGDAGAIWFTAILVHAAGVGDVAAALLDPRRDVVPRHRVVPPGVDTGDFLAANQRLMEESQLTAAYAAYRLAGRPATLTAGGAEVLAVAAGSAAAQAGLLPGDVITTVDGRSITFAADLNAALAAAGAGDEAASGAGTAGRPLTLTVLRASDSLLVSLNPGSAESIEQLGLTAASRDLRGTFDPPVRFEPGEVAGPSAGLAFGLYLVERLAPGTIRAAGPVAATGTVAPDGTVGPVGGIPYKARAVLEAGARIFVVPAANAAEARRAAPDLHVIGVTSLAEAVQRLGGQALTPFLRHTYNVAGLEAIPVAHRYR